MGSKNGILLAFAVYKSGKLAILLSKDDWKLGDKNEYRIDLLVDKYNFGEFAAYSFNGKNLVVSLGSNRRIFRALQSGYTLTVRAAKQDFSFDLSDSARALDRVQTCVDLAIALRKGNPDNPFALDQERPRSSFQRDNYAGMSKNEKFIATLLKASGLEEFEFDNSIAKTDRAILVSWRAKNIVGFLAIAKTQGRPLEELTGLFFSSFAKECLGEYAFGSNPTRGAGRYETKRSFAVCRDEGKILFYVAATALGGSGGATIIAQMGQESVADQLRQVNKRLEGILIAALK